jgi:hypothetical protein
LEGTPCDTQDPPEPPLPPPLPPLDEPLVVEHWLAQLCSTHASRLSPSLSHELDALQFDWLAPDGHTHEYALEQLEFAALTCELQLLFRQLVHAELPEMPAAGQLVAE